MTAPVDWDELYPGRFLKAGLIAGTPTLTIASILTEELIGEKGPQVKGIVAFSEDARSLPLNKTNGICLREMFGRKVQEWVGKRVTLFASTWNGEPCLRIWGSPDIPKDTEIIVQLPRRKPFNMVMHATGKPQVNASVKTYLDQMKRCETIDMLVDVKDAIVEDNSLSTAETAMLNKALAKRTEQLTPPASA
jgi:hypothetical protein